METNIVSNIQKDSWNSFVVASSGSFLQSFEWGEFKERLDNKVFGVQTKEGNKVLARALVINHKLPFGLKSYFYIPYGPCFKNESALKLLFQQIRDLAKKQSAIFLRVEPLVKLPGLPELISKEQLVRVQPQKTLVLDIKGEIDSILQGLPKAARYSIRQAEKYNLTAEFKDEYTPEFYQLMNKTSNRGNFTPHHERYYKGFFDAASESFKVKMCLAKHNEKIISASMLVLFNKTATYLHAASDKAFNKMQGPTFLMWEQIKLAKQMGCTAFDFWGIDEKKWPGVTHFKKSFGGREVLHPKGRDIVFNKFLYGAYKLLRRLK